MRKDNGNRDRTRQKRFIETIQSALGRDPARPVSFADIFPEPEPGKIDSRLQTVRDRSDQQRQALLTHLKAQGKPLNLNVVAVNDIAAAADFIATLVREKKPEWGDEKRVAPNRTKCPGRAVDAPGDHPLSFLKQPSGTRPHTAPLSANGR